MTSVFISFRNGDEPFAAASLYRALAHRLGAEAVFRSSDSIEAGTRWAEEIWAHHRRSEVVVVVIGPRWLTVTDDRGRRRLWQRTDWVRMEVDAALREGKQVIPVLLAGVKRFTRGDLPRSLAGLASCQSVPMDHRQFESSLQRVVEAVCQRLADPPQPPADPPQPPAEPAAATVAAGAGDWLAVWNVPSRAPGFVDRENVLRALWRDLDRAQGQRPVVLHGEVGAGKSQLAIEYAYRFAGDYHLAWWVDGSDPALLWTRLAALADAVGYRYESGLAEALPGLARQLRQRGRWLLVFDDVADPGSLTGPLAALGAGVDVLVTSRSADWGLLAAARRPVERFERCQSLALLRGHLEGTSDTDLERLADAVDDLPLALAQVATDLPGSSIPAGQYVDLLRTRTRELLGRGETYVYRQSLAAAWSIGEERLRKTVAAAGDLLDLLAVLAPAPVPVARLAAVAGSPACLADPLRRADAVRGLAASGLVPVVDGMPCPHGLLQAFLREGMPASRLAELSEIARQSLAAAPRPDPREPAAWPEYGLLLPHVRAVDPAASPEPRCHELLLDVVHHLSVRGDPAAASELAAAAVRRWRGTLGPTAPATLDAMDRLAQAHFRMRDYPRALALDEEVLAARRQLAGEDDPRTLAAAHHVALARYAAGHPAEQVRELLAGVVAARTRVLGPDHPDTLRSAHNLALVERAGGDLSAAAELDARTFGRLRAVLGPDHPDTLRSAHAVVLDRQATGELAAARELAEDTYQRRQRVLGSEHPDTLRSLYRLAVARRSADDQAAARELAHEAYERWSATVGAEHTETLRTAYLLGAMLREAGDPAGEPLLARAAAGLRRRRAGGRLRVD